MNEPKIWSHITDLLPNDHPLAGTTVSCTVCGAMVHCSNNECMQTWLETGRGPHCAPCFVNAVRAAPESLDDGLCVLDDEWGLPS